MRTCTKELDKLKDFDYRGRITRVRFSIPSNIAEGNEGNSNKEFAKILNYAEGSAGELVDPVR